jgi:hypothetical protein
MIQRIQTLFLIEIIFLSVSLLFVPVQYIVNDGNSIPVSFVPLRSGEFLSGAGHYSAIIINFLNIVLSVVIIFMYKKRELQVKLCYLLVIISVILICMIAYCPFVSLPQNISVNDNMFAYLILLVIAVSAYLAAHFVKKDIALLKSADRIR